MTDRQSLNGDGKGRTPSNRITSSLGGQKPGQPENEHEQQVITALTGRYDQIEALWNEAEEDLKRFRIPRPVEHCYYMDEVNPPTYYRLSFTRYGKGWRICHERRTGDDDGSERFWEDGETKPIIECPLDLRLAMIPHFETLRKKVIEAAEKAVPTLDNAISSFRKMLKG